jgi:hypothetical protein
LSCPDILGLPWSEAEVMLKKSDTSYVISMTRPTRNFFETDEQSPYVIRTKYGADGILEITLAVRLASS